MARQETSKRTDNLIKARGPVFDPWHRCRASRRRRRLADAQTWADGLASASNQNMSWWNSTRSKGTDSLLCHVAVTFLECLLATQVEQPATLPLARCLRLLTLWHRKSSPLSPSLCFGLASGSPVHGHSVTSHLLNLLTDQICPSDLRFVAAPVGPVFHCHLQCKNMQRTFLVAASLERNTGKYRPRCHVCWFQILAFSGNDFSRNDSS